MFEIQNYKIFRKNILKLCFCFLIVFEQKFKVFQVPTTGLFHSYSYRKRVIIESVAAK